MPGEPTVPAIIEALGHTMSDVVCLVHRTQPLTFAELACTSNKAGNVFAQHGLGTVKPREGLPAWVSGQDHVALLLRNGPEYLQAMLGAFAVRAVPFNVNFRYTTEELAEIFAGARPKALVTHAEFAGLAVQALELAGVEATVLQVADDSGQPLTPGIQAWGDALAGAPGDPPCQDWSPDDLYMLFTGGTTGRPKGVLWRQADALVAAFNVVDRNGAPFPSVEAVVRAAAGRKHRRVVLPTPPFIHGASQWLALNALLTGNRLVIQDDVVHLDPPSLFGTIEREGVTELAVVGDAFARPLVEAIEAERRQLPSLRVVLNGGAAVSEGVRRRLLRALPRSRLVDSIGSSESGRQASRQFEEPQAEAEMVPLDGSVVVSEDRSRVLPPGDEEVGWLARQGYIPLGYLGDEAKTRQTFPLIDGTRYVVPGDRARLLPDGRVVVLGRDSTTINTGGEKVYGEEVEAVLVSHPEVRDAVVLGRASDRWGQEVVALVACTKPVQVEDLLTHAARTLARYKLPKEVLFVAEVPRTPAGKADHRAAHALADAQRSKAVRPS